MRWIAILCLLCGGCAVEKYSVTYQPQPVSVTVEVTLEH